MVLADATDDRVSTARLVLNLGLAAAIVPVALVLGSLLFLATGMIDWWTAWGRILIGDGGALPFAMQAEVAAVIACAAGLAVTWWAGPERFYSRAMLNLAITAASLLVLVLIAL